MARYTLERINQKIALWEAADDAVSFGQQYSMGGRRAVSLASSSVNCFGPMAFLG
jgi:hypothetical protein